MKVLGKTKTEITTDENGKNILHLETNEVLWVHCNIFNNYYQTDSRVLYEFVTITSFGQLLDTSPKDFIFLKTSNSKCIFKYGLLI